MKRGSLFLSMSNQHSMGAISDVFICEKIYRKRACFFIWIEIISIVILLFDIQTNIKCFFYYLPETLKMLKWTVPRRAEPAEDNVSHDTAEPTRRRSYSTARHSFGGQSKRQRRHSLLNKENDLQSSQQSISSICNPQATSTPFSHNQHSSALRDLRQATPSISSDANHPSIHQKHIPPTPLRKCSTTQLIAPTLPTFGLEYSPMNHTRSSQAIALRGITVPDSFFGNAMYFRGESGGAKRPKLEHMNFASAAHYNANNSEEESDFNMSSKALNDQDLDQMIEEILASTQKIAPAAIPIPKQPTVIPNKGNTEISLRLRQFMETHQTKLRATDLVPTSQLSELLHEHPSLRKSVDILASLNTPPKFEHIMAGQMVDHCLKVKSSPVCSDDVSPTLPTQNIQMGSSISGTPSSSEMAIRRCLKFSESPESIGGQQEWMEKRHSVASNTSTTSSLGSTRTSTVGSGIVKGALDLSIRIEENTLNVHGKLKIWKCLKIDRLNYFFISIAVLRCKELCRSNGGLINAYVKVSVLPTTKLQPSQRTCPEYQRTSVHRNSSHPLFDHRFVFDGIAKPSAAEPLERVQLTVWHRDRALK